MTVQEFSNEFDILYNNITSNQAPGLDEYEKSVFLTKAQDEIVRRYFNPKENKNMEGFDGSEKRQIDFSTITKVQILYKDGVDYGNTGVMPTLDEEYTQPTIPNTSLKGESLFDPHSNAVSVDLSDCNIMMILNEITKVSRSETDIHLITIPISYTEYTRLMSKPYKHPIKSQAWRLINNNGVNKADIIIGPNDTFKSYKIRYVERPKPIILTKLSGLTIGGQSEEATCQLDPILHQEILQRAVELAKATYEGTLETTITLGGTSQTNLGTIPMARQQ